MKLNINQLAQIVKNAKQSLEKAKAFEAKQHELFRVPGCKEQVEICLEALKNGPVDLEQVTDLSPYDVISALKKAILALDLESVPAAAKLYLNAFTVTTLLVENINLEQARKNFDHMLQCLIANNFVAEYDVLNEYFLIISNAAINSKISAGTAFASVAVTPLTESLFSEKLKAATANITNPLQLQKVIMQQSQRFVPIIDAFKVQIANDAKLQDLIKQKKLSYTQMYGAMRSCPELSQFTGLTPPSGKLEPPPPFKPHIK